MTAASFRLDAYLDERRSIVDQALRDLLPPAEGEDPLSLRQAMAAAVLEGGKRLRPCLTLATCEAVGGTADAALVAACAVELIHAYSLVHDDLPAMDNDDFRRGKPTCHKRYGEATAILTGDALLTLAFAALSSEGVRHPTKSLNYLRAAQELATAAGIDGMVGGQAVDMQLKDTKPSFSTLEACHTLKTAALFSAAATMGGHVGGGSDMEVEQCRKYGLNLGLAFQHADDLLDAEFVEHKHEALKQCTTRTKEAIAIAESFASRGTPLVALAKLVEQRAQEAI